MDSVRFGRVLGIGTRLAAKTVVAAVDAATAPNPSAPTPPLPNPAAKLDSSASAAPRLETRAAATATAAAVKLGNTLGQKTAATGKQVRQKQEGFKQGKRRFGEAVWGPFTKAGKVLWLEFTGVFFGLFALSAGMGAWKLRAALLGAGGQSRDARLHLFLLIGVAVVFGYFCVSGFVRAVRRGRR